MQILIYTSISICLRRYTYIYIYIFYIYIYLHILTSTGSLIAGSGIRVLFVGRPGPSGLRREGGASICEEIGGGSEVARAQRRNSNLVRHTASLGTLDKPPGHSLRGISGTNARGRDLVNVAWAWRLSQFPDASLDDITRDFYVDLSQSVPFGLWSEGFVRTLCKSTRIYSFQWDMVLKRRHQLACMGLPLKCLRILGDHNSAFAFAGNAFACPSIATALIAFYLKAEGAWWH